MAEKSSVSRTVVPDATFLPQAADATLYWDGSRNDMGPQTLAAWVQESSFQAKGPPVTACGATPCWTTGQIGRAPAVAPQAIAWKKEAALMTFSLSPVLLAASVHRVLPEMTGELLWFPRPTQTVSPIPAVHPALLVHRGHAPLQAERVTIVPSLRAVDPLFQHMALVLQAAIEGDGEADQLYTKVLTDALAVHFFRRFVASKSTLQQATGGLAPFKLRRTIAYIQDHLEQTLSVGTLAAVAQTSPAHFARLFKQATGRTPHQYVIACRMARAKRLLVETDMPLSEIGPEVGCADQSHFTALFRKHVSMTPQVYRNITWGSVW